MQEEVEFILQYASLNYMVYYFYIVKTTMMLIFIMFYKIYIDYKFNY